MAYKIKTKKSKYKNYDKIFVEATFKNYGKKEAKKLLKNMKWAKKYYPKK